MKAQMVKNAVIVPRGRQGRVRGQAPPAAGDRDELQAEVVSLLSNLHLRAARRDRQHRRRRGRAAARRGASRRGRSLPGGGRGQGHGHVLGHRQRHRRGLRVLARRRLRVRWLDGLRPQGHGHHGARGLGVGQASFPRARPSTWRARTSPWPGSATCRATCSATACCCRATSGWWPRSTTATSSSTPTPMRRPRSRSASGCSRCPAPPGTTTTPIASPPGAACSRAAPSRSRSPRRRGGARRGGRAAGTRTS